MQYTNPASSRHPFSKAIIALLIVTLVLAPLFRAGNTPLASLMLQWLGIVILVGTLWTPRAVPLSRVEIGILMLVAAVPILYLIPLPSAFVNGLPGRDLYAAGEALLSIDTAPAWKSLSIHPDLTFSAGLSLLLPVAIFVGTRSLDSRGLLLLVKILLAVAAVQAILGLVQYGAGQNGAVILTVSGANMGSAVGTYANRNHLAGLLVMILPLALALLYYNVGREGSTDSTRQSTWRRRAVFLGSTHGNAALLYGVVVLIILVGVVFTRSRMGIAMGIIGLIMTTLLFSRRIGGTNTFGLTGTIVAVALSFGIAIGLAPVLDRFSVSDVVEDGRVELFSATLLRIAELFPFGSGPGTFSSAFPPVQPMLFGGRFPNHAHNDYLEWISDAGLIAVLLILAGIAVYLYQWTRVYLRGGWPRSRFIQAGAGVGLLVLGLHEFVDYNLAIPANQAVLAFLAGVFFIPPERLDSASEHRSKRRRTPDLEPTPTPRIQATGLPTDQIENPFKDA
ncbi:O-antigen ligase family protein [Thiocapsa bogorovii]|uniref:O-antigen ligase family protein n=1 Tax=Thiocapsa bogorovii TaxID=521689 RepID=UPI001E511C83|nr:O-antigen ligase family protein [Thiocapsa bogorovii]UHD15497.1 O-antigen ligase family protein [Thiocapsa bogorovii]